MVFERRFAHAVMIFIAALIATVLFPAVVHASPNARDRETARSLMDEGDKNYKAGDYGAALNAYKAAYALVAVPTTGIAVANTEAALGHLVEARDTALAVMRYPKEPAESAPFRSARSRADELARALLSRIPSVQVSVAGPPAGVVVHVELDGHALPDDAATLPAKVNPGTHSVVAWAEHYSHEAKEINVVEGTPVAVSLALRPELAIPSVTSAPPTLVVADQSTTPPPEKKSHTFAYVGIGLGVVGVAVGSATGIISLSKTSGAKQHCTGNSCTPDARSDLDAALLWANVSNVAFAVGVVGAAIAVVSTLSGGSTSQPTPTPRAKGIMPLIGPSGAAISGWF